VAKPGIRARQGYRVRDKGLCRSKRYLKRFRRQVQRKLDVHRKINSVLSDVGSSSELKKKVNTQQRRSVILSLLEKRLEHLKEQQSLLQETQEKLKLGRDRDERPTDQKRQTLTDIISRLEQELKLRSNLHQLQSTKVVCSLVMDRVVKEKVNLFMVWRSRPFPPNKWAGDVSPQIWLNAHWVGYARLGSRWGGYEDKGGGEWEGLYMIMCHLVQ
jgi:hypothetical protein